MPPQPSVQPSEDKNFYVGLSTLTLAMGILLGWAVWGGGWTSLQQWLQPHLPPVPTTEVTGTNGEIVQWNNIANAQPIKKVTSDYGYDTVTYGVYQAGIIKTGIYQGDVLAFAASAGSLGTPAPDYGGHLYYISDKKGTPIARWKNAIASYGGEDIARKIGLIDEDGVTSAPLLPVDTFPAELIPVNASSATASDGSLIHLDSMLSFPSALTGHYEKVDGKTYGGNPIIRTPASNEGGIAIPAYRYGIQLPFGAVASLYLEPDFIQSDQTSPPNLTWTSGNKQVASYNYGGHAYGWNDCFKLFDNVDELAQAFTQTGLTASGNALYELNIDNQHASVIYYCLYQKTQRYNWDPTAETSSPYYPDTYGNFIQKHPIFFWKHPFGDWIPFVRSDVVPAAEKAKPVIYLYPTRQEQIRVIVDPIGGFTNTIPAYSDGWTVLATPQGTLTNLADGKIYPYLFWEGGKEGVVATPKEGFVVAQAEIATTLDTKLTDMGLSQKERTDFLEFWVPKLSNAPYYFLTFIPQSEIDRVAPLTITPTPDSVIRVLLDYEPLQTPRFVQPLPILETPRSGFTVVEWGGIMH